MCNVTQLNGIASNNGKKLIKASCLLYKYYGVVKTKKYTCLIENKISWKISS